jgi:CHAT domain
MESLRIDARINERTRLLETVWSSAGITLRELPTALRDNSLPKLRATLGRSLQRAKDALGSALQPSWAAINEAMEELRNASDFLVAVLFPHNAKAVVEIWREALAPALANAAEPPTITLVGADSAPTADYGSALLLPFEFLPFFREPGSNPAKARPIDSESTLRAALEEFVGYRCIVSRVLPKAGEMVPRAEQKNNETDLLAEPRFPAKVFVCRTLPNVGKEEWRLRRQLEVRSVWPRRTSAVGTADDLAELLWLTTHTSGRKKHQTPDQIHHFATHFDTTSVEWEKHAIKLAGSSQSEFTITLYDLTAKIGARLQNGSPPERNARPLVFVNACGTSKMDPHGASSLPGLFLGPLCSRGFIGTETTMSDSVAMEFASEFYARLARGAPIGRALHDSRRALVAKFCNPLGLFYTCYAHPGLKARSTQN